MLLGCLGSSCVGWAEDGTHPSLAQFKFGVCVKFRADAHLSPCDHPRLLAAVCTTRGRERRAALGRLELI